MNFNYRYCITSIVEALTMKFLKSVFVSLLFLSLYGKVLSDNTCESKWEPYKDEKCLKAFDTEIIGYEEAENYCREKYDANLVSIGKDDKQKFVENFLKSQGILNEVWIGLKYQSNDTYVWSDNTNFHYSNWGSGSPKNDPAYCVQIETEDETFGNWVDVPCAKRNVVLCEKAQPWSLSQMQTEIMNLKENLIPIGFMYVQLPKEKPPAEIWPWMSWEDISSDYESVFFRVDGRNSSSFGTVQEQTSPRITDIASTVSDTQFPDYIFISPNNKLSSFISTARQPDATNNYRGIAFVQSNDEVRPRNMAIRIWKRTQ